MGKYFLKLICIDLITFHKLFQILVWTYLAKYHLFIAIWLVLEDNLNFTIVISVYALRLLKVMH